DDAWVIDCGVKAFRKERLRPGVAEGSFVEGQLQFGVDPHMYFEYLAKRQTLPELIYSWEIAGIRMQTAPYVRAGDRGWVRDKTRLGWRDIDHTDAWHDDDGHADYLLECRLLDVPP